MEYLKVKNFEKYQHYSHRRPPWIKLYWRLLGDQQFVNMTDASKLHTIAIMLLASQHDNRIPFDKPWIARAIFANNRINWDEVLSSGFVICYQDASNLLATCAQHAIADTEVQNNRITETEDASAAVDLEDVITQWNSSPGVIPIRKLNGTRKKHLLARLDDPEWPWRDALSKFPLPCFNGGGWKPNFDFLIRPATADLILEGKYNFKPRGEKHEPPPMAERLATDEDKRSYNPNARN